MASVFRKKGAGPWLIEYFDQHGRRKRRSSGVTDRRAAERIAAKIEADVALRKEGVVDARHERFAEESRKPLAQHVQEYLQHCRGRGVAVKSLRDKENQLEWLMAETRASRLGDLTLEAVERVLAAFWKKGRSSRTVNSRRETFRAFGNWCRKTGRTEYLEVLNRFLLEQADQGNDVVLLIDESQDLEPELLEQVRLLSNLETDQRKLLQIVLIGQPELREKLNRRELRQLRQRITVRYHLAPLNRLETERYIVHRLRVAGAVNGRPTFSPWALRTIHRYSGGVPRLINAVCDKALLYGYVNATYELRARAVRQAIRELEGEAA